MTHRALFLLSLLVMGGAILATGDPRLFLLYWVGFAGGRAFLLAAAPDVKVTAEGVTLEDAVEALQSHMDNPGRHTVISLGGFDRTSRKEPAADRDKP